MGFRFLHFNPQKKRYEGSYYKYITPLFGLCYQNSIFLYHLLCYSLTLLQCLGYYSFLYGFSIYKNTSNQSTSAPYIWFAFPEKHELCFCYSRVKTTEATKLYGKTMQ